MIWECRMAMSDQAPDAPTLAPRMRPSRMPCCQLAVGGDDWHIACRIRSAYLRRVDVACGTVLADHEVAFVADRDAGHLSRAPAIWSPSVVRFVASSGNVQFHQSL